MSENKDPFISIVVPIFNEENNILNLYDTVTNVLNGYKYEIFFCNNCSTDKSWQLVEELHEKDERVKGISYSRNFGFQRSIYMGYLKCHGDIAIQLDCDLQDPPAMILKFIEHWKKGNKIVYGIRRSRQEGFLIQFFRKFFYRMVNYLSEEYLPLDAGEFRLVDRVIIEQLRKEADHQPYLRGMIATLGFKQHGIEYDRDVRKHGDTKFSFFDLMKIALDGILNHSVVPLRIASLFGVIISIAALSFLIFYISMKLFFDAPWPAGFTTLTVLILIGMGVNALFLGIIGEYIGRIYKQVKNTPIAIVEKEIE